MIRPDDVGRGLLLFFLRLLLLPRTVFDIEWTGSWPAATLSCQRKLGSSGDAGPLERDLNAVDLVECSKLCAPPPTII